MHLRASLFLSLFIFVSSARAASFDNKVYLIRHGEKPSNSGQGLSPQGKERAQCLTGVFGPSSPFDIGFIMAETPKKDGDRERPVMTVTPLASELGLNVDTSCDRDDSKCVAKAVKAFAKDSTENILICWEHAALKGIASALGINNPPDYPDNAFDIIWTIQNEVLISKTSENCTGLDNEGPDMYHNLFCNIPMQMRTSLVLDQCLLDEGNIG